MRVKDIVELGLRCPGCDSEKLRAGYHDFQSLDSFICEECGLRWQEDADWGSLMGTRRMEIFWENLLKRERRLIWIMTTVDFPFRAILNPKTSDETDYDTFLKEGTSHFTTKGDKEGET